MPTATGFTLVLDTQNVDEGKRWFDNLAANGKIEMDWQETFWAHGFGKVSDRYGVPWMIRRRQTAATYRVIQREASPPVLSSKIAQLFITK